MRGCFWLLIVPWYWEGTQDCTRSWRRMQAGQLTQTDQRNIPYYMTLFSLVQSGGWYFWEFISWWWAIVLCISFCIVLHHSLSKYSYLDPQSLVLLPFLILCSIPLRVKESKRLYGAELLAGLNHSTCSFGNAGTVHLGSWYNDWESPTWSQWF